jgi:hypothetical protein
MIQGLADELRRKGAAGDVAAIEAWLLVRVARGLRVPPLGRTTVEVKRASYCRHGRRPIGAFSSRGCDESDVLTIPNPHLGDIGVGLLSVILR